MLNLIATGKSSVDDVTPLYLWGYGNSKYEIEARMSKYFTESEVLDTSYEDALENFNEALSIDPENIEATIGKAWCLFFMDSGSSMEMMRYLFEKGVDDSTWAADANCALSIVTFAQGHYTTAIAYADSLLSIDPVYVLDFYTEIDYYDILLVKAQAQFLTLEYDAANTTMAQVNPSLYLDPSQDSWEVNGTQYLTFESALSAVIASVTSEYDSEGFISNP